MNYLDRNEFNYAPSQEVVEALKNFDINKLCFYTRIYDEGKKSILSVICLNLTELMNRRYYWVMVEKIY